MDGKFDDDLDLIWAGKGVAVRGPLSEWEDDEESAFIHVAITQNEVVAFGRTGDDVPNGADEFVLAAGVAGKGALAAGPATATAWAFIRSTEGPEMYEWTVPVTLKAAAAGRSGSAGNRHARVPS